MGIVRLKALSPTPSQPAVPEAGSAPAPAWTPPREDQIAGIFIDHLELGRFPFQVPADREATHVRWPVNAVSSREYPGVNALNLAIVAQQKGDGRDPRFVTYDQARYAGWQVRAGEKAAGHVYFYKSKTVDTGRVDPDTNEKIFRSVPRLVRSPVFHASQVDRIPPHVDRQFSGDELKQVLHPILHSLGVEVVHNLQLNQGREGVVQHDEGDTLYIADPATFASSRQYEARVASMLMTIASRELAPTFTKGIREEHGDEERSLRRDFRAEVARAMLSMRLGLHIEADHIRKTADYIDLLQRDPKEARVACRDAERMVDYLVSFHPDFKSAVDEEQRKRKSEAAAQGVRDDAEGLVFDVADMEFTAADEDIEAPRP